MPSPPRGDDSVEVRLLRTDDLVVAHLTAPGCHVEDTDAGPMLVVDADAAPDSASLVLVLPPQHLGEQAWPEGTTPAGLAGHRAAEPTRLVFALAADTRMPYTLEGILGALPTLLLRVASHATPASSDGRLLGRSWADALVTLAGPEPTASRLSPASAAVLRQAQAGRLVTGLARSAATSATSAVGRARLGPGGVLRPGPLGPVRPFRRGPRPPTDTETSIEAPYRVQVSPSRLGAFTHDPAPTRAPDDASRTEVWRTHLTVRVEDDQHRLVALDDTIDAQRIVRAVWSRDLDPLDADHDVDPVTPQSLDPQDRRGLVRQTSDGRLPAPPRPIDVRALSLSSLGAWVDWQGAWVTSEVGDGPLHTNLLESYRHQAVMGRDQYVRVSYPGFLYPFGHRAAWVKLTERKVEARGDEVAALFQRFFLIVRQRSRSYTGHDSPFVQVVLEPLVTPDLDPHTSFDDPWVPTRGGQPFAFSVVAVDRAGATSTAPAPLVFVPDQAFNTPAERATIQTRSEAQYAGVAAIPAGGQVIALAQQATAGDTALEVNRLVFRGDVDAAGGTSRPSLVRLNAVVPAMRHLAPQAPGVDLVYAKPFLAAPVGSGGFDAGNPGQLFVALAGAPPAVDFSGGSERSGGFLAPNLLVRGLSRTLGAVGEDGTRPDSGLAHGQFNAAAFLDGALPKLFGMFSLLELLDAVGIDLAAAPRFVTEALDTVSGLVSEADRLRRAAADVGSRLQAEVDRAAHAGAAGAVAALKAQLDAVLGPLLGHLQALLDAVAALPGGALPAAADAVTGALAQVAVDLDALLALVGSPRLPVAVAAMLDRPARALKTLAAAAETVTAVADFAQNLLSPATAVTARFEWQPVVRTWTPGKEVFVVHDPATCLRLAIEVRAGATTPPAVDVAAEITDFALQLLPGAPLMALTFSRIGFRASSGQKPQVDVVFDGIEFLGPLSFIDTLRRMIPFDGFADP
ncbi:MAG: hypothetical protein ABJA89_04265, partial [Lapillicoccus sp.]